MSAQKDGASSLKKLGTQNLVRNLGVMFVIAAVILLLLVLLRLIRCIIHRYPLIHKIYTAIHQRVFYNLFIRYILQSALKVQIAVCTTIELADWSKTSGKAQGTLAIILIFAFT